VPQIGRASLKRALFVQLGWIAQSKRIGACHPQRQVHAVLGAVGLEDKIAVKRRCHQFDKILTYNLMFGNYQRA
jgi:hypothetical protein